MITLSQVKNKNGNWFSRENKNFFGDIKYFILHDSDKKPYLIRLTNGWSDMFTGIKKPFYCINEIDPITLEIGDFIKDNKTKIHREFKTLDEVKTFLK